MLIKKGLQAHIEHTSVQYSLREKTLRSYKESLESELKAIGLKPLFNGKNDWYIVNTRTKKSGIGLGFTKKNFSKDISSNTFEYRHKEVIDVIKQTFYKRKCEVRWDDGFGFFIYNIFI
ncbi:MAG: hypothetical protein WC196_07560 [Bacilli bacterium]